MLTEKYWRPDALVRLLLSLFICVFAGSAILSAVHCLEIRGKIELRISALMAGSLVFLAVALVLVRAPWRLENFLRRAVVALGCFYAGVFLGAWAEKLAGPLPSTPSVGETILATLSIQGASLILITRFVREHEQSWSEAFGLSYQWPQAVLWGLLGASLFVPLGWVLQQASVQVMTRVPHFPIQPEAQQVVQTLREAASWGARAAMGVATIGLAPAAEELLFRGILYPAIKQAGFPRLALWGTSMVFALVHFTPVIFLPLLALALLLVKLYEKTGNLLAPIAAHSLFNGLNFVMVLMGGNHLG